MAQGKNIKKFFLWPAFVLSLTFFTSCVSIAPEQPPISGQNAYNCKNRKLISYTYFEVPGCAQVIKIPVTKNQGNPKALVIKIADPGFYDQKGGFCVKDIPFYKPLIFDNQDYIVEKQNNFIIYKIPKPRFMEKVRKRQQKYLYLCRNKPKQAANQGIQCENATHEAYGPTHLFNKQMYEVVVYDPFDDQELFIKGFFYFARESEMKPYRIVIRP